MIAPRALVQIGGLALAMALVACKGKGARASAAAPPSELAARPAVPSTPPPSTPAPAPVVPRLTPEQAASTVRVRISVGPSPVRHKHYLGAMLHRDEVAGIVGMQGNIRCVLALLSGWKEEDLRQTNCRITVLRKKTDGNSTSSFSGQLLQFDTQTGLAAIAYIDRFDADIDSGFHLQRKPAATEPVQAVRSASSYPYPTDPVAPLPSSVVAEAGLFVPKSETQGDLQFSSPSPELPKDASPAIVSGKDKLLGFVAEAKDATQGTVLLLRDFKLDLKLPKLKLVGIAFGRVKSNKRLGILIKAEPDSPASSPMMGALLIVESPDAKDAELSSRAIFEPISSNRNHGMSSQDGRDWYDELPNTPQTEGQENTYLLQLGWTVIPRATAPSAFSQPFIVKLRYKGGTIVPTVTGLPNLNETQSPEGETRPFALEAPVHDFHEIAGGREVLIQFATAPFWKRFSFTRNEWLPLPPVNLANAYVTGNLSALFILDRGSAEVRKYDLTSLRQMGTMKLPAGVQYVAALAGCNTDKSPVHVIASNDCLALSSETLQRRDFRFLVKDLVDRREFKASVEQNFHIPGDGLSFLPYVDGTENQKGYLRYLSDALGAVRKYYDTEFYSSGECGSGVSGAYLSTTNDWLTTLASPDGKFRNVPTPPTVRRGTRWLSPSAPVIIRENPEDPYSIPPRRATIQFYSYFDTEPFSEFEPSDSSRPDGALLSRSSRYFAFDPYSLRTGQVSYDRKQWVVHQLVPSPKHTQPILLNWPDPIVSRGGEFHFKPQLLGSAGFTAEVLGAQKTPAVTVNDGEVSFRIAPDELASLLLLNLKIPGKEGQLSYPIPLHVLGSQQAIAASPTVDLPVIDAFGEGFKSIPVPKDQVTSVRTTVHPLMEPVRDVLGPVAGHLVLVNESGRLDFFSIEERKIAHSVVGLPGGVYQAGAGALFEYSIPERTLTRISVPGGQRERNMTMPGNLRINAFAVGMAPTSPLTLIVEQIQKQTQERFGNWNLTWTTSDREPVILDSRSFQAAGWAQPKLLPVGGTARQRNVIYDTGQYGNGGGVIPASFSGQFVTIRDTFLMLSGTVSYAVQFPQVDSPIPHAGWTGSISGMLVADPEGRVYRGGAQDANFVRGIVTPCGRYRLVEKYGPSTEDNHIEVRSVENDRLILRLARLTVRRHEFSGANERIRQRLIPLGDHGPMAVLSGGGRILEVADYDLPLLAQSLNPKDFHVTSQAPPCVVAGGTIDYKVEVNNPAAVASFRLPEETPGVSVSPQGILRYIAPSVTVATRVEVTVEVQSNDGQTISHAFPIFVLPRM